MPVCRKDVAHVALLIASEKEHSIFVQPTLCNAIHNGPNGVVKFLSSIANAPRSDELQNFTAAKLGLWTWLKGYIERTDVLVPVQCQ